MRSVQFLGLARILRLINDHPKGLRAKDLNDSVIAYGVYKTDHGKVPSATTLYHCRSTLVQLGAVTRDRGLYRVKPRPEVTQILTTDLSSHELNSRARDAFATLVLLNSDCQAGFFKLFCAAPVARDAADFRARAMPVTWTATARGRQLFRALLRSESSGELAELKSNSEIRSILYGVRYWARNELRLIDEYYRLDRGSVMFAVKAESDTEQSLGVLRCIRQQVAADQPWTTIAMQDLLHVCCESGRRAPAALWAALDKIVCDEPGRVVLIPSAETFATNTLSATLPGTQAHELGSYYRDRSGRLISHIRLHCTLAGGR